MRMTIPAALVATLLIPAAAMACPNCILHGTAREDAAWSKIVGNKAPAAGVATASVQPAPQVQSRAEAAAKPSLKR